MRHDRGIADPQSIEPMHLEVWVDNGHLISAHLTGAAGMVVGLARSEGVSRKILIGGLVVARHPLRQDERAKSWLTHDVPSHAQTLERGCAIVRIVPVVRVDEGHVREAPGL